MSKSKMHKQEVGKSRPTENRASNAILNEQVNEWIIKLNEAGKLADGVNNSINGVANVLTKLILEIKRGNCPREVISEIVKRVNITASLNIAKRNIEGGINGLVSKGDR